MKGRKQFFFEKKNQKTFIPAYGDKLIYKHAKRSQSFLVLFFKKELLPPFL